MNNSSFRNLKIVIMLNDDINKEIIIIFPYYQIPINFFALANIMLRVC